MSLKKPLICGTVPFPVAKDEEYKGLIFVQQGKFSPRSLAQDVNK